MLNGINGRLNEINGRLNEINGRLNGINGRLNGINGRLNGINGRLNEINGRLNRINGRLKRRKLQNKATVNTSAFANGVYILKLSSEKQTGIRKFVKEYSHLSYSFLPSGILC